MAKNQLNTNIVIVCWNALEYTKLTLKSLFETVHHPYVLTIVDNASTDGTQEYLKKILKPENCIDIHLIFNQDNNGYGGAINQGYEVSKKLGTKYTCVCNNDVYFEDNWLSKLESDMMGDKEIGIISVMRPSVHIKHPYYDKHAKAVVDGTPENYDLVSEFNHYLNKKDWNDFLKDLKKINRTDLDVLNCPPESVVTYCALVRNKAVEKIFHLADPQFEIYGSEDVDLSWSLQEAGYKCCIDYGVYVHHFRHKSIKASKLDREKYLKRNNNLFFKKWSTKIYTFLNQYTEEELNRKFNEGEDDSFWFLRLLNQKIGFWDGRRLVKV